MKVLQYLYIRSFTKCVCGNIPGKNAVLSYCKCELKIPYCYSSTIKAFTWRNTNEFYYEAVTGNEMWLALIAIVHQTCIYKTKQRLLSALV